ncbi:MAG TPA: class I SAM-dependent methyltransferase [Candidatus Paceibacterota bacterium]
MGKDTSWNSVADWYDELLADKDSYQQNVILPNLTRLVGEVRGKKILDLAAGQGFFSEALSKAGAQVTAIDISPELIAKAKQYLGAKVICVVGSAELLPKEIKQEPFDAIICILALQNIRDINAVFAQAASVLKKGGKFHVVLNHPAFRIPKGSSWGFDPKADFGAVERISTQRESGAKMRYGASEKGGVQYRRVDGYLSESETEILMHPGEKKSPKTVSFHRPLQLYSKASAKRGFVIERLEEWVSHKESQRGPRKTAEDRARKEFPLFLYLGLVKV